ncbi:hypothetical protein [Brevundimonas sp.]|uniref:hypothetical protein n=1 Tax=Brevundimonas sp. TaxID=1871086 RepID=UPI002D419692|nr:hypothetical protein [Brevundimonas sp.]HYD26962.1 hypothetical protein [Brevundimonas sp.]
MSDLLDPVPQTVWKDIGWQEPMQIVEVDESGALTPYLDLASVTEIRAAMQRRTERGVEQGEVIAATLSGETVVVTDADEGTFEIQLPASDAALTAATPGTWDLRVVFTRDDGTEEPVYVGVREIREGF